MPLIDQNTEFQWPMSWHPVTNDDTNFLAVLGYRTDLAATVHFDSKFYGGRNNYQCTVFSNPI